MGKGHCAEAALRGPRSPWKLVSTMASNPQANCHLKPQVPEGHKGTQTVCAWEGNKSQQRAKLRRESPEPGPEPGSEGKTGRGGGAGEADRTMWRAPRRARAERRSLRGHRAGWGPGRKLAGQLPKKSLLGNAGSLPLIKKKASARGAGGRRGGEKGGSYQ